MNRYKFGTRRETATILGRILPVFGVAILILGIWIGVFLENRNESEKSAQSTAEVFGATTIEVARGFVCPCGSCGDESLTVCVCPTALEAKRFIEANLKEGHTPAEVVEMVKNVYGHYRG
ncbi:MAG: hypothetical protein V3U24_00530 [Candidatus Neomarinimicrobiota bacterium]